MSTESTGIFATKEYRFLCWLDAQQTATPEGPAIKMSQSAIAEAYGSSPATINGWIKSRAFRCQQRAPAFSPQKSIAFSADI